MKRLLTCLLLGAGMAMAASAAPATPLQVRANGGSVGEIGNVVRPGETPSQSKPVNTASASTLTGRTATMKVPKLAAPASAENLDVYIIGNDVDGAVWMLADPNGRMTEVSAGVYEWNGTFLKSGFKFNDGTWSNNYFPGTDIIANIGWDGKPLTLGEPYHFFADGTSLNISLDTSCEAVQYPHVELDLNEGTLIVTGTAVPRHEANPELYLYGNNVDESRWQHANPGARMTEVSAGVYEWNGEVLGTSFYINDGTVDPGLIPGTEIIANFGSNGSLLEVGEPYHFKADETVSSIGFAGDCAEVKQPHVVLNLNDGTIVVTGTPVAAADVIPTLYLRGSFNDWGSPADYRMTHHADTGLYTLESVTFPEGNYMFKVASADWMYQYGSWGDELIPGVPFKVEYDNSGSGLIDNISANLGGTYDVTLDTENLTLLFTQTSGPVKPEIDYSDFALACGGEWKQGYALQATEVENRYVVPNVPMTDLCYFYLYNLYENAGYVLFSEGYNRVTPDGTATLYYWTPESGIDYLWYMGCDGFDGLYDVTIDFNGETAELTFSRSGDLVFYPGAVMLKANDHTNDTYLGILSSPSSVDGHTAVYGNLCLNGDYTLAFTDLNSAKSFGTPDSTGAGFTPDNMTVELALDGDSYWIEAFGLSGVYDLTVVYNEDFTRATATLTPQALPDVVATYTGDLYLIGEINGWQTSDPDYKMTCVEPGLYEWSGDRLDSSFKFNGGDWNTMFPDTDIFIDFGGYYYPSYKTLTPGETFDILNRGSDIQFADGIEALENVHVTVDLREMTVLVTGDVPAPPVDITSFILVSTDQEGYQAEKYGDGIVYHGVRVEPGMGFAVASEDDAFGWPDIDVDNIPWITEEDPETTLVSANSLGTTVYYAFAYMEGYFDVFVNFNSDMTEATMRFEKTGEIYAYVNVTVENGVTFSVRSQFGGSEYVAVSTNDEFWAITGYTENGRNTTINYVHPQTSVWDMFEVPEDGNLDVLFFTEYVGECKVIDGTVGAEVAFDNKVTFTRTADGVEIRGIEAGDEIAVYTIGGQLVTLVKAQNTEMTVTLEKGQAYVVRAGAVAAKVVM